MKDYPIYTDQKRGRSFLMRNNWNEVKADYVNGMTYSELSKKYGISVSTISKRGGKYGWSELRKRTGRKIDTKIVNSAVERQIRLLSSIQDATEAIVKRVKEQVEDSEQFISPAELYSCTKTLSSCMQILGIQSALDEQEQEARIAKLRKEAREETEEDKTIRVVMSKEVEDFCA